MARVVASNWRQVVDNTRHKEGIMKETISCFGILVAVVVMTVNASAGSVSYRQQTRGATPAASSTGGEACSALKKEDVAAALGGAVNGPSGKGPLSDGTGSTVTHVSTLVRGC
jgi:hypothetical protein